MLARELDFHLPPHLIAQTPLEPRDAARLLVLRRNSGEITHRVVRDLPDLLQRGDLLVFNDTRVLRARLRGFKPTGGRVEALLLKERGKNCWEALLKPSKSLKIGGEVEWVSPDESLRVASRLAERNDEAWQLQFSPPNDADIRDLLPVLGEVPLPPYIRASAEEARYQTTFSRLKTEGNPLDSAAAPTAGLHFTPELLLRLQERGIESAFVTLAVGAGTFRPVQSESLDEHPMHAEEFSISAQTAAQINAQKARGGRVVAVGTTTVRTLESVADARGHVAAGEAQTSIFIRPGFEFRCVDALLTNFHLPRSTLLALVGAFAESKRAPQNGENGSKSGLATIHAAYAEAIAHEYRFFSFGDAMLID
ncbi:MAG: tRNA preQ1(34) S-adenosylmethionine ribosyltransferase-isomerase QueA [Armatimonadetes bacterium]|nr:tRNA preQ1(34) S-adenosylmethionine ribosyltransferase-isomerase QueA [Armatimonadota bacterium]